MATTDTAGPAQTARGGTVKGIALGLGLAATFGGAAFYAIWSGLVLSPEGHSKELNTPTVAELPDIAFIPIPPFVVSLGTRSSARHLRFQAQLEVNRSDEESVTYLMPRIVDILNGYLRAVEPGELEQPGALTRIRAQMLRRAQIVAGEGRVRDLLIMEFVLN